MHVIVSCRVQHIYKEDIYICTAKTTGSIRRESVFVHSAQ